MKSPILTSWIFRFHQWGDPAESNTRELIFKVPRLISYISTMMPLVPGDIISTGTPAGVGMGRTPQRWLKPGDDVVVEIAGIGSLQKPCLAEP